MAKPSSRFWRAGALIVCALGATVAYAQVTVSTFEGIDASQDPNPELNVDPNGAIGTKQYMEWTNIAFQAWDKTTLAPVWPKPQVGHSSVAAGTHFELQHLRRRLRHLRPAGFALGAGRT